MWLRVVKSDTYKEIKMSDTKDMYDIEIDYTTGHSFASERDTDLLGNISSLKNAKENLKRIRAHYIECKDNPNSGKEYNLTLLTDEGERTIQPFWIGYFESLHGAKIVKDVDPEMYFDFREENKYF
jgi:hypothetical protein